VFCFSRRIWLCMRLPSSLGSFAFFLRRKSWGTHVERLLPDPPSPSIAIGRHLRQKYHHPVPISALSRGAGNHVCFSCPWRHSSPPSPTRTRTGRVVCALRARARVRPKMIIWIRRPFCACLSAGHHDDGSRTVVDHCLCRAIGTSTALPPRIWKSGYWKNKSYPQGGGRGPCGTCHALLG